MTLRKLALRSVAAMSLLVLGGCGVYVGNIRFTAVEVCSEEYASRLHPNTGCLPPTRAENAQGFFLRRYRLPLSPDDANAVTSTKAPASGANHVPSMIGRIFEAVNGSSNPEAPDWRAPPTGNIEFIALGDAATPPQNAIATEILVETDLAGVVQRKLSAGAELNPAAIVDAGIVAAGIPAAALPSGLRDALVSQVVKIGYQRDGFDAAKGSYYYVSMKPAVLDSLTSAFAICDWAIDQDPGKQKSREIVARATGATLAKQTPASECHKLIAGNRAISSQVKDLIRDIEALKANGRSSLKVAGMVVGVAILHTDRGFSEVCTKTDIVLIEQGKAGPVTLSCGELRNLLNTYKGGGAASPPAAAAAGGTASTLSDEQKKSLIVSLSASYAKASLKTLEVQSHTSILAIHWVPIRIAN